MANQPLLTSNHHIPTITNPQVSPFARRGLDPAYGSHTCSEDERRNRWALVASDAQNRNAKAPVQSLGFAFRKEG